MTDNSVPTTPSRREMWLRTVLAAARGGLPVPERHSFSDRQHAGEPFMYLHFDSHGEAHRWAAHYGVALEAHERPDLGRRYVQTYARVDGWYIEIKGVEPLVTTTDAEQVLAAELVDTFPVGASS